MSKVRRILKRMALLALAATLAPDLWAASQIAYRRIAEQLARLAERSSVKTIAVIPLKAVSPADRDGSDVVSERLVTHLAQDKRVQVVERALLDKVLAEQKLQRTGMVDETQIKKLGRVMGVDAVVSGSIVRGGKGKAEINARLIDSEDARVLGSASAEVARDWVEPEEAPAESLATAFDSPSTPEPPRRDMLVIPATQFDLDIQPMEMEFKPWWEAKPASAAGFEATGCDGWERRLDALDVSSLELKARFWSEKLLTPGFSRGSLTRNPGSEIHDLRTRADFYRRLKQLYDSGLSSPLSEAEENRLTELETQADDLRERCQ